MRQQRRLQYIRRHLRLLSRVYRRRLRGAGHYRGVSSAEIGTIVSKVDSGELAYQLFPKVNAVRFFKEIPRNITYNPVDIETTAQKHEQRNTSAEPNVFNCATLVGHLLKIGGMPIFIQNNLYLTDSAGSEVVALLCDRGANLNAQSNVRK